jgi:hypothetical protein
MNSSSYLMRELCHGGRTKTAIAERQNFSALLKMLRAGLM